MVRMGCSSRVWVSILILLSIFGCGASGTITHLIPEGYVGPVVIVFDDPKGEAPKQDGEGGDIYEIPPDGVLRLNTPAPKAGFYDIRYFYIRPDGTRWEIPWDGLHVRDKSKIQVFALVIGATGEQEDGKPIQWTAYMVGVPSEFDDWYQVREEATRRAIGLPDLAY